MEEIDKVYAEDLQIGDIVALPRQGEIGSRLVEITGWEDNGDWITVSSDADEDVVYVYGQLVPIYGYMSVEV